jgi:hypothetical protein
VETILIAHRDATFAEHLTTELRKGGYRVIDCGGPWPRIERCIRCDKGYCPLPESADLMIYDPQLTGLDQDGHRRNLAVESALAHPEVPLLLAWGPDSAPDAGTLRAIRADAPNAHVAAHEPGGLLREIRRLLAPATEPEVTP